jgi:hypothetical protein
MIDSQAAVRPILVAASQASNAGLARSAIEELGIVPMLVQDVVGAIRHSCGNGRRYGAMVVGERIGEVSGVRAADGGQASGLADWSLAGRSGHGWCKSQHSRPGGRSVAAHEQSVVAAQLVIRMAVSYI